MLKAFKYLFVLTLPLISLYAIHTSGWQTFLPVLYAFGLIPLLELVLKPDPSNLAEEEEQKFLQDRSFDVVVYFSAIFHLFFFIYFFLGEFYIGDDWFSWAGRTLTLGLMCGVFGINIAHELGHRSNKIEQMVAQVLLLTSLYMHFFIEHNRGHHRYVSTEEDPASAPRDMSLYRFWFRSIIGSFLSAWRIEKGIVAKSKKAVNKMMMYQLLQAGLILLIWMSGGTMAMVIFLVGALVGILLLETVNYIEHYGLRRKRLPNGNYERAMPRHSWNSNHQMGRLLLFELSRHSDHHYLASRKYQILRHHDDSPQLPTGYPGMMILAFFPPIWFRLVHAKLELFQTQVEA